MKNKKYILGVDGGNTKTDYFLFDTEGNFIDAMRFGTCSHEALKDSFSGTRMVMGEHLNILFDKNNITIDDVEAASFGLAGADIKSQKDNLNMILKEIGFKCFQMDNDGILGLKAASPNGRGVCSINGTGTVCVGVDEDDHFLQVGGIGYISGDEAGGAYMVRRCFQVIYQQFLRCGEPTTLTQRIFDLFKINSIESFLEKIVELSIHGKTERTKIIKIIFEEAKNNDPVALSILEETGKNMALGVAGCINNSKFDSKVYVVLAGSVWSKASNDIQVRYFEKYLKENTNKKFQIIILDETPAYGAIIWAFELYLKKHPDSELISRIKNQVLENQKNLPST